MISSQNFTHELQFNFHMELLLEEKLQQRPSMLQKWLYIHLYIFLKVKASLIKFDGHMVQLRLSATSLVLPLKTADVVGVFPPTVKWNKVFPPWHLINDNPPGSWGRAVAILYPQKIPFRVSSGHRRNLHLFSINCSSYWLLLTRVLYLILPVWSRICISKSSKSKSV